MTSTLQRRDISPQELEALEKLRQPCEVFSRVVGYLRPVDQWNAGKQAEFYDREYLLIKEDEEGERYEHREDFDR